MNSNCLSKLPLVVVLFVAYALTACTSTKQVSYFNDLPDSITVQLPSLADDERIIENGDQLEISFNAKDNVAASFFNKSGGNTATATVATPGAASVAATNPANGYLVDHFGYLEFPIIGSLKVSGMTASQLKAALTKSVNTYLKEPIVEVRFSTFKVSVLGMVNGPGTFNLSMQKPILLEALAAAGDLPLTANRTNVQIYRDYNGKRTITKFDLTKKNFLYDANVFQLKHNDIIYVKPRPVAAFREDFSFWASMLSIVIGVVTLGYAISK